MVRKIEISECSSRVKYLPSTNDYKEKLTIYEDKMSFTRKFGSKILDKKFCYEINHFNKENFDLIWNEIQTAISNNYMLFGFDCDKIEVKLIQDNEVVSSSKCVLTLKQNNLLRTNYILVKALKDLPYKFKPYFLEY